jgi:hypothetical protein
VVQLAKCKINKILADLFKLVTRRLPGKSGPDRLGPQAIQNPSRNPNTRSTIFVRIRGDALIICRQHFFKQRRMKAATSFAKNGDFIGTS